MTDFHCIRLKHWFDTQSISKELEGWREEKFERHYFRTFFCKFVSLAVLEWEPLL